MAPCLEAPRLKASRICSRSQRWLLSSIYRFQPPMLYMGYILPTARNGSAVAASLPPSLSPRDFRMKASVRHFEWHCLCQTPDWRRHMEKCCANEIAWPTSFSAIHSSKDTGGAFIQVNHDWSLKWKRGFSAGRGASIIYYSGAARHLGDNAVLQAYKT